MTIISLATPPHVCNRLNDISECPSNCTLTNIIRKSHTFPKHLSVNDVKDYEQYYHRLPVFPFLLLLIKHSNLFKVLACSTTLFHLSPFCVTFFQLHTFMLLVSSKTSSSQRNLGLPVGLLDMHYCLQPCVQRGSTNSIFVF